MTGSSPSRQKTLLLILGGLALITAWRYFGPSSQGDADLRGPVAARPAVDSEGDAVGRSRPASRSESRPPRPGDRVSQIRIAELDGIPSLGATGRDPWSFVDPPPPPPVKQPPPRPLSAAELEAMRRQRELEEERRRLAAIEAAKPRPAEFTWQYIGQFGPANKRIAVFSDGKKTYNALEGETLDKKFILARIGLESVEIRFVGFPEVPAKRVGIGRR